VLLNLIGQQRQYSIGSFDMRSGRECRHAAAERSRRPKVTKASKARPELKVANEPKTVVAKQNSPSRTSPTKRELSFRPERGARSGGAMTPHEHGHMHAGAQMQVRPSPLSNHAYSASGELDQGHVHFFALALHKTTNLRVLIGRARRLT
jgi:hypothetical protein